jgi:hypothetical protein
VLPVLLEQDHGEQTRPGKAARQHGERCRRLADLLAVPAGELLAHDLHDLPLPRHHFEPLGHVLTELGEPVRATAATGPRAGHDHALARQMRRERLARGPSTREGANLRGLAARGHSLLGRNLVLGRRRFELLELKLHLVDEPRLALVARSKQVALELLDHQPKMHDQRFRARRLSPCLGKLSVACQQQPLQRLDIIGERIIRAHRRGWNHKRRLL